MTEDIIEQLILYAADLTHAIPENGLVTQDGRIIKPNLELVWKAASLRHSELIGSHSS